MSTPPGVQAAGLARTIVVSGTGGPSLSFEWPAGVELTPEAIFADIDATGAGADVTATLTIQEQSGVVIAKKAQGSKITAGAPGSATWGLRLPDDTGGGASGATGYEAIRDGVGVSVPTNTLTTLPWVKDFGDTLLGLGAPNLPDFITAGMYAVTVFVNPLSTVGAPYTVTCQWRTAINGAFQAWTFEGEPEPFATAIHSGVMAELTRTYAAGNTMDLKIRHNAGVNVTFGLYGGVAKVA